MSSTKVEREELTLQPFSWEIRERLDGDELFCWAFDRESKVKLVRFQKISFSRVINLPAIFGTRPWKKHDIETLVDWIRNRLNDRSIIYRYEERMPFFYYSGKSQYLRLGFPTGRLAREFDKLMAGPVFISDLSSRKISFKVYEEDINPILKLLAMKGARYAQWFRVTADLVPESECMYKYGSEYTTIFKPSRSCKEYVLLEESYPIHPVLMTFDIEAYSKNHKKFPNPSVSSNPINIITVTTERLGIPGSMKYHAIVTSAVATKETYTKLRGNKNYPDATIEVVHTEKELLLAFCRLIKETDPDIISGYNIFSFDWPYLDARWKRHVGESWPALGRIQGEPSQISSKILESNAFGRNEVTFLDMKGRISIDMLTVLRVDYTSLPSYTLAYTSSFFLKNRQKLDMKASEMFRSFKELRDSFRRYALEQLKRLPQLPEGFAESLEECYERPFTGDIISSLEKYMTTYPDTEISLAPLAKYVFTEESKDGPKMLVPEGERPIPDSLLKPVLDWTEVVVYGLRDADVVSGIFNTLNMWQVLTTAANIYYQNPGDIYRYGQIAKGTAMVYVYCYNNGYVMNRREKVEEVEVRGANTVEGKPGNHPNTLSGDFASLYPSIMVAENISTDTLIHPSMYDLFSEDQYTVFKDTVEVGKTKKYKRSFEHRFVKASIRPGVFPMVVKQLLTLRKEKRAQLKLLLNDDGSWKVDPTPEVRLKAIILDQEQLNLKRAANSLYGFMGAQKFNRYSLIEGAESIAYSGYTKIVKVREEIFTKFGHLKPEIVYGDTDSFYLKLHAVPTGAEAYRIMQNEIIPHINGDEKRPGLFPEPIKMEFENMWHIIFPGEIVFTDDGNGNLTPVLKGKKKHRVFRIMNKDGEYVKDAKGKPLFKKKGVTSARRDNCKYITEHYDKFAMMMLDGTGIVDMFREYYRFAKRLLAGEVSIEDLTFRQRVKSLSYKQEGNHTAVYISRMMSLGRPVQAGEEIFYIYTHSDESDKAGYKMFPVDYYKELKASGEPVPAIDYKYYFAKKATGHLDRLFVGGYADTVLKLISDNYSIRIGRRKPIYPATPLAYIGALIEAGYDPDNIEFEGRIIDVCELFALMVEDAQRSQ